MATLRSVWKCAAIGFANTLEVKPFELVPVLYEPNEQDKFLTTILEAVFQPHASHAEAIDPSEREEVAAVAAHIAAQYVWAVGAQLKDPAFAGEQEWRLMTLEMINPRIPGDLGIQLETKFRSVATRIVPYKTYSLDYALIREIVLGSTVSMEPDDPAFSTVFRECVKRDIPTSRSPVKVRQ